jgi:hypothetical protein
LNGLFRSGLFDFGEVGGWILAEGGDATLAAKEDEVVAVDVGVRISHRPESQAGDDAALERIRWFFLFDDGGIDGLEVLGRVFLEGFHACLAAELDLASFVQVDDRLAHGTEFLASNRAGFERVGGAGGFRCGCRGRNVIMGMGMIIIMIVVMGMVMAALATTSQHDDGEERANSEER